MGAVSAGGSHSLVLGITGLIYSFGLGYHGRLGHGDNDEKLTPAVIEGLRGVRAVAVAAGSHHSLVLGSGGEVYAFGGGGYGQLGHGNKETQLTPQVIQALKGMRVRAVAAGVAHSLVLSVGGEVYSFGRGGEGQLGHGNEEMQLVPKRIEAVGTVRAMAAGEVHSMLLTEAGAVYSFGEGESGQLGYDAEISHAPRMIKALQGAKVRTIAVGSGSTSYAVATAGRAYGWGYGEDVTLGLGLTEHQPTPLQYSSAQLR
eukprot:6382040-Prymnesium_polylepis.1